MMDKVQTKRYWYFVTQEFMGRNMELHPRVPHCAGQDEPDIKRICVAPTAAHCMSAISFSYSYPIYVYRTSRRVNATKAWGVEDSSLTHEHFLLRRSRFELVASISPKWVESLGRRDAFEDRGARKGTAAWDCQVSQRRQLIRAVSKLDRRLAIIKLSDEAFRYEGEHMLLGGEWPDSDFITNREDELILIGVKCDPTPAKTPDSVWYPGNWHGNQPATSHVTDLDICSMYLTPVKLVSLNAVDVGKLEQYSKDFV